MANPQDYLVPGTSKIFIGTPGSGNELPDTVNDWDALPHTVSWEISADVEDAPEIRTSDTNNLKVGACGGATSFELNITSALCSTDWLYAYILSDVTDPSAGKTLWFYIEHEWSGGTPPAAISDGNVLAKADLNAARGPLMIGTARAPGINFDNDASEVTVVEWSVSISAGPYLPRPYYESVLDRPNQLTYSGS